MLSTKECVLGVHNMYICIYTHMFPDIPLCVCVFVGSRAKSWSTEHPHGKGTRSKRGEIEVWAGEICGSHAGGTSSKRGQNEHNPRWVDRGVEVKSR